MFDNYLLLYFEVLKDISSIFVSPELHLGYSSSILRKSQWGNFGEISITQPVSAFKVFVVN